jgi:regulatory protein
MEPIKQPDKPDKSFLERAAAWCAYQERSQHSLRLKLPEWGCTAEEAEELIARMIAVGFINEERFARAYAGGKFRMKHWGKLKIREGLKLHRLTLRCIEAGLSEIPEQDYLETLQTLATKKWLSTTGIYARKKAVVARYLQGKGYEAPLIWEVLSAFNADP